MKSETDQPKVSGYGRFMQLVAWTSGIAVAILSLVAFVMTLGNEGRRPITGFIMMPVGGYLAGFALSFLFAPTSYLDSEQGKKSLELVGVKSHATARVIAGIFALLAIAFFTFFAAALLTNDFKDM